MSHTLFEVGAILSQHPVPFASTSTGESAFARLLMMLRVLPDVFVVCHGLKVMYWLLANAIFLCWHALLFSMLLAALSRSEYVHRHSFLPSSLFCNVTVMFLPLTSIAITYGFSLGYSRRCLDGVHRRCMKSSTGPLYHVCFGRVLVRASSMTSKRQLLLVTVQ